MKKKTKLKDSYFVEEINNEIVLLTSDDNSVVLSNQVGNAVLLEIAQQKPSMEELLAKFSKQGVSPFEVMQAMHNLEVQGYIAENIDFFTRQQTAYWETLGFDVKLLADILQKKNHCYQHNWSGKYSCFQTSLSGNRDTTNQ